MELYLQGLSCAVCAEKIQQRVNELPEVKKASLSFATSILSIVPEAGAESEILQATAAIVAQVEPDVIVTSRGQERADSSDGHLSYLLKLGASGLLFLLALLLDLPSGVTFVLYLAAYLVAGGEVIYKAVRGVLNREFFDENFLMTIATIGAFAIGEYPEGVAVMLFYQLGEFFQSNAVRRSRRSIADLMDIRPDYANLKQGDDIRTVLPETVRIDDVLVVRAGEKIPLDAVVVEGRSFVNTSALTGESLPREVGPGDEVFGGFINTSGLLLVRVTKAYSDSTVARILALVEDASNRKAPTEKFITRFSRVYTPIVVGAAVLLAVLPPLLVPGATFADWVYRALIFLVISCPCALVISIPLGFFGGIGGASRKGILVKGGNYLEALNHIDTVVFDKTGTLTKGVFDVAELAPAGVSADELLEAAALAEYHSTHPIGASVLQAWGQEIDPARITDFEELAGLGLRAVVDGREILAGNARLLESRQIPFTELDGLGTVIYVAVDSSFIGSILIADDLKADAARAVSGLKAEGVKRTVMLTGDKQAVGSSIGQMLGIDTVFADLLPDQKVAQLEAILAERPPKSTVVYVGDGINDAPALARADVGVAMGGLGSDAAIEAADVVLMTDEPTKLVEAIRIARRTRRIVWQNIILAFAVKGIVLILGAGGLATMWEAVFADVGVAVLAVLNAMRVLRVP